MAYFNILLACRPTLGQIPLWKMAVMASNPRQSQADLTVPVPCATLSPGSTGKAPGLDRLFPVPSEAPETPPTLEGYTTV